MDESLRDQNEDRESKNMSIQKLHECQACGKLFTCSSSLRGHVRSHNGEKPHICEPLNEGFSEKYIIDRHLRSNLHARSDSGSHTCKLCEKQFPCLSALLKH